MFTRLNKIIRNNPVKKGLQNESGQAAVVLILIIAAALVFYAVSLNFGYFSQIKGMVTIASNTSAALMASGISSYAQMLSETQLGGKRKVCSWTGVFAALITLIIVIIVTWLTWGAGTSQALVAAGKVLAVVGVVLSATALVLQVAVIQPGITGMWNDLIQRNLSLGNQFTENAIQNAFTKTVTDPVMVPDVTDIDMDGFWEEDSAAYNACIEPCGTPDFNDPAYLSCIAPCAIEADVINRFSAYYTERLRRSSSGPVEEMRQFLADLDEFLHQSCDPEAAWGGLCRSPDPDWGLHDHMNPQACVGSAECHPCCVPDAASFDGFDSVVYQGLRPDDCDPSVDWATACSLGSPFGGEYPWVFDPAYENPVNDFFSFRELIGKDDENRLFYKRDEISPVCDPSIGWDPYCNPQLQHAPDDYDFYLEDTTGYYVAPQFVPDVPELRKGIFPFFYKMRDWGVDLSLRDIANMPRECHWCDERGPDPDYPLCTDPLFMDGPHPHPNEIPQLVLPLDPTDPASGLAFNTSYCVDGQSANVPGNPPLWVDKVDLPTDIFAAPNVCAENTVYPDPTPDGFWKPGMDNYCSSQWPYMVECPKNAGSCPDAGDNNCSCADVPGRADQFPDDTIDGIYNGLAEFIVWAETLLGQGDSNIYQLALNLQIWYPDAGRWMQPAGVNPCGPGCELSEGSEGYLYVFLDQMIEIRNRLEGWIVNRDPVTGDEEGYAGATCEEVWCVPPEGCPLVQEDEAATFDANGNGVYGDIEDVVACLDHNINTDGGNAARFQECYNQCNACALDENNCPDTINEVCGGEDDTFLPRSLVPGWDPNADFVPLDTGQLATVQACESGECADCFQQCTDDTDLNCRQPCDDDNVACQLACTTNHTTCTTGCGSSDPLDPGYNPNYATCITGCDDTLTVCIGDTVTCQEQLDDCNAVCNALDPSDPLNDIPACLANCTLQYTSPNCEDGCVEAFTACNEACDLEEADCIGNCQCTSAGTGCTAGDIAAGSAASRGSCGETGPDTFLDYVERSIPEATNQVAKFQHRKDFLGSRITEVRSMIDEVFDPAIQRFQDFLNGPARDLVNMRANFDPEEAGLPYQAVYGWQDPPEDDGTPGKWHIVRTDARVIDHCDERCDANQTGPLPGWPWVRTYTKSWGLKRCYELTDFDGSVKFRTVRYDQESEGEPLTFPNGEPIWQFRTFHPKRPQGAAFTPGGLSGTCSQSMINNFVDGSSTGGIYDGAFLMDKRTPENSGCWELANRLLTRGTVSQTCAVYDWINGRMDFRFVPCEPF